MNILINYFNKLYNLKDINKKIFEILDDLVEIYGCTILEDYTEKDIRTIILNKNNNKFIIKTHIFIDKNNLIRKNKMEIEILSHNFILILNC